MSLKAEDMVEIKPVRQTCRSQPVLIPICQLCPIAGKCTVAVHRTKCKMRKEAAKEVLSDHTYCGIPAWTYASVCCTWRCRFQLQVELRWRRVWVGLGQAALRHFPEPSVAWSSCFHIRAASLYSFVLTLWKGLFITIGSGNDLMWPCKAELICSDSSWKLAVF